MVLITVMVHGATEQSPSNSMFLGFRKAVLPGPPVQKSEAIPPDIYQTSRYVSACDEFYQAFPCVSILQVTNAGLEGLLPNSPGMFLHMYTRTCRHTHAPSPNLQHVFFLFQVADCYTSSCTSSAFFASQDLMCQKSLCTTIIICNHTTMYKSHTHTQRHHCSILGTGSLFVLPIRFRS